MLKLIHENVRQICQDDIAYEEGQFCTVVKDQGCDRCTGLMTACLEVDDVEYPYGRIPQTQERILKRTD